MVNNILVDKNDEMNPNTPREIAFDKYSRNALKLKPLPNFSVGRYFCNKYTLAKPDIGKPIAAINIPIKYIGMVYENPNRRMPIPQINEPNK